MKDNGAGADLEGIEDEDDELYTELDDERRAELTELMDAQVLGIEIWESSWGDEANGPPPTAEERVFFDCDLFLEEDRVLELYVAAAYPDPEGDPVKGMDPIFEAVGKLADDDMELLDFDQADEEGGLAVAFGKGEQIRLVLVANAWQVSEWEAGEEEDEDEDEV
jgi:hypothetical protein